jgi:hypothetical protein
VERRRAARRACDQRLKGASSRAQHVSKEADLTHLAAFDNEVAAIQLLIVAVDAAERRARDHRRRMGKSRALRAGQPVQEATELMLRENLP